MEHPIVIMKRLLAQQPGPQNIYHLKASRDFFDDDWAYEDVADIEAEFAQDFRYVAAQLEAEWGPPEFIGSRHESDFPEFYVASELAYWRKGHLLAIIWWEHQDREVPVLLTLAVMTPSDAST